MERVGPLKYLPPFSRFATEAIHAGQDPEQWRSGAVVPPISLSTTFKQRAPGEHAGYEYSRSGNPTRDVLEKAVAALDGAKYSLAYSSVVGAILNICHLLKAGDRIICMDDVCEGTRELFHHMVKDLGLHLDFVDCTNPANLDSAITPETKLVWIETPTSYLLKVVDIHTSADVVKTYPGVLLAVDNSSMSPYLQRPLSLGADICVTSATKYMNGHSDVLLGLVSVNDDKLYQRLKVLQSALGAVPSPFDCYLCNRGLKTLHIRMKLHFQNSLAVAKFLESHPRVEKVIYPGLPSHPQYRVMHKQCTGCPGMVSFYVKGGKETALSFLTKLKVFIVAVGRGAYVSLAEHPATMSHATAPDNEALGISDTLIRLSVGLEDEEDLLADLGQALNIAFA